MSLYHIWSVLELQTVWAECLFINEMHTLESVWQTAKLKLISHNQLVARRNWPVYACLELHSREGIELLVWATLPNDVVKVKRAARWWEPHQGIFKAERLLLKSVAVGVTSENNLPDQQLDEDDCLSAG